MSFPGFFETAIDELDSTLKLLRSRNYSFSNGRILAVFGADSSNLGRPPAIGLSIALAILKLFETYYGYRKGGD